MNSKQKGKRGELELAHEFERFGYDARRGVQYNGADGSADVIGLPGLHVECKRVENLNIRTAVNQAVSDARKGEIPAVFHKRNRGIWLVTLTVDDFMRLYDVYRKYGNGGRGSDE